MPSPPASERRQPPALHGKAGQEGAAGELIREGNRHHGEDAGVEGPSRGGPGEPHPRIGVIDPGIDATEGTFVGEMPACPGCTLVGTLDLSDAARSGGARSRCARYTRSV